MKQCSLRVPDRVKNGVVWSWLGLKLLPLRVRTVCARSFATFSLGPWRIVPDSQQTFVSTPRCDVFSGSTVLRRAQRQILTFPRTFFAPVSTLFVFAGPVLLPPPSIDSRERDCSTSPVIGSRSRRHRGEFGLGVKRPGRSCLRPPRRCIRPGWRQRDCKAWTGLQGAAGALLRPPPLFAPVILCFCVLHRCVCVFFLTLLVLSIE